MDTEDRNETRADLAPRHRETLAKSSSHLREVPPQYIAFIPAVLAICFIGLASKSPRVQAFLAVAWSAIVLSYLTLTALDKIVAH